MLHFSCEIQVLYTKISRVNFELVLFTCELGISYAKTFTFHMRNENFICETVSIPCFSLVKRHKFS